MGTRKGALKAKAVLLARDPDWYKKVGAIGGRKSEGEVSVIAP